MGQGRRSRVVRERQQALIGYIRVSTGGQAESGAGLAAQRSAIRAEASRRGMPLARIYEDRAASAKSLENRDQLQEALAALAGGEASVLVVAKLDRLSRSIADFAALVRRAEREGWSIVACDLGIDMESPTGGLLANVTASVAEWERKIISTRTKEALAAKRASGTRLGRPTLLEPVIAQRIKAERVEGRAYQAIADGLNHDSVLTPTGGRWSPALVRKVAIRER
ncbi:MAG TPA: recombinase family protein [Acidimicrobiales bacterium]